MGDPRFLEWAGRLERLAASPGTIKRIFDLIGEFDVRDVLPSIRVPTLVMHRRDDSFIKVEHSRYIAERVPGARYVELEGTRQHVRRRRLRVDHRRDRGVPHRRRAHASEPDRMLATVMFTDIVDSTRRAADLGDRDWRDLLERHDQLFRRALDRHRGREIKRTGDGFLATFDGPARAIRCAASITDAVEELGLELRAGLHTGELEVRSDDLGRPRRAHRGARDGHGRRRRGARVQHREGPRGGLRDRLRGPGHARASRGAGRLAPLQGDLK